MNRLSRESEPLQTAPSACEVGFGTTTRSVCNKSQARAFDLVLNKLVLVPYSRNPDYVARSFILETIKERFGYRKNETARQFRVSLFGLGGVGYVGFTSCILLYSDEQHRKTQIALAFAYWIHDNLLDTSVFWVHASNADRFHQAFTSIAEECQVPGRDDPQSDVPMLVRRWLERKERGRWIMIVDNADDKDLFFPPKSDPADTFAGTGIKPSNRLSDYLPDCMHGSILITTRNKKTGVRFLQSKSSMIEVDKMSESEAGQLLHKTLGDGISAEEASCLSARLEHLPLAIAQAAAFIQENSISTEEYLRLLDNDNGLIDQLSEPFETVGRDSDTPNEVTATWVVSFNQIQRQDILASEILSLISLLDRQAIPKKLIMSYCDERRRSVQEASKAEVTKALGTLKAFSLVAEAKDNTINMHRLVQLVTRKWLVMQDKFAEFTERALETVSEAYPYGNHETRQTCVDYLPHAIAVLGNDETGLYSEKIERATLLICMTGYFLYSGQWNEAERSAVQSVNIRQEILGEAHPDTLTSMANLASTYRKQGRWKEAEELEVRVMEMKKKVLGNEHPSTLTSIASLASIYRNQGRWKEAEELEVRVMETTKRVLGEKHPSTLSSIANLALTYGKQGRWKQAEELDIQVMETRKKVLGEEHPDMLTSMANLASTYRNQSRWKEAEELEVRVIETISRVLGKEHPSTLSSMANLASTYRNQGRWKEAEELDVQVMEMKKRVLGKEHPSTLTSMTNLALTYGKQGRWKEAKDLNVQVMEIRKRIFGEEHPSTLSNVANLALIYWNQGRWKEAEELEVRVIEARKRVLGEEHPDTLISMANLASIYWNQGRWKKMQDSEVKVMEMAKRVVEGEDSDTF